MRNQIAKIWKEHWPMIILIGTVVLIWLIYWRAIDFWVPADNRGIFGDKFGGVNALFAGLAFAGLIYAIILQKKELSLQREELKATREELCGQKEQLAAQNMTFLKQSFENNYFQMLKIFLEMGDNISWSHSKGRLELFTRFYEALRGEWERSVRKSNMKKWSAGLDDSYKNLFPDYAFVFSNYFRTLYRILKFVKYADIEDKRFYTGLLRAQLNSDELLVLFYNCLSAYGGKLKPLVEEFSLLKFLPENELLSPEHMEYYDTSAFGREG